MNKHFGRSAALAGAGLVCGLGALIFGLGARAQPGPPPQKDMTIDAATRKDVIAAVIANLDQAYVFPDRAAAMDARLRTGLQHGEFDTFTSASRFAQQLTETLRGVSHDPHLEVRYFEHAVPPQAPGKEPSASEKATELTQQRRFNYGVATVGRLQGNLGYIDMHQFGRLPGAADRNAAAMDLLADTRALIVDLRHCGGGDPDSVMVFASYLFDQPTHLNDIYWREENRTEHRWTQAKVAGHGYGQARKVYLLTSTDTFSGCEDLAYALKNNHRALLVGETTGGGAHAGDPHRLSAHFMMFVPSGRPINPVTHTDWEGVGVAPDVRVPAAKALDVAQVSALEAIMATEPDAEWKARLRERLDDLK
jgi:hypothetical protein